MGQDGQGRSPDVIDLVGGLSNAQLKRIVATGEQKADDLGYVHHMGHIIAGVPGDIALSHVAIRVAGLADDYNTQPDFEMAVYRYAAALDIDPQDIAPINQHAFAAAGQSQTLDEKNRRSLLFGWDRKFMHLVANHLLDAKTRFTFAQASGVSERAQEADVLHTVSQAISSLTNSMVLGPDQARQVGIDYQTLPTELGAEDQTLTTTLTDTDPPEQSQQPKKRKPATIDTGQDL